MSRIRADRIVDRNATGAPSFPNGAVVTGVATATSFSGNLIGNATGLTGSPTITVDGLTATGAVSIGGQLTYEDVANVDSVGLITKQIWCQCYHVMVLTEGCSSGEGKDCVS